jgi:fructose-1,6-bisphosphatase/inositol monophosphatase family enzyme
MRFGEGELATLRALLEAAVAAEVMPRFGALAAEEIRTKSGPLDLVTVADERAEAHMRAALARHFPGALIIGEEGERPRSFPELAEAELAFTLDPLDGTANFAAGVGAFGAMAAAVVRGETVGAVILDPLTRTTALALKGSGAWLEDGRGERRRLRVADPAPVEEMTGFLSWRFLPRGLREQVCGRLPRLRAVWDFRCAAVEYRLAAAGICHFLVFNRILPWDHAPGVLLFREAGGYVARFDGSPYSPAESTGGLIAAPDRAGWEALAALLLGGA